MPKKKAKESDELWKIAVAFVIVILVATIAIYFVGRSKTTKDDPKDKDNVKETAGKSPSKEKKKVVKKKPKDSQNLITNKYDKTISKQLTDADKLLKKKEIERAHTLFEKLVRDHPDSPRAMYGLAKSLDELAEVKRSNQILQQAIDTYGKVDKVKNCPVALKRLALMRQAERLAFLGRSHVAANVLKELSKSLPHDVEVYNKMGVQHLMSGQNGQAKKAFQEV